MDIQIEALQIAELFNIKKFRAEFRSEAFSSSTSEVFYALTETNRYLYVFDYGVVVFANYDPVSKSEFIQFIKNYATKIVDIDLSEEYTIKTEDNLNKVLVKNDHVTVSKIDSSLLRIVMLNIGQSVALEYYEVLTDELITSSKHYILELEQSKHGIKMKALVSIQRKLLELIYVLHKSKTEFDKEYENKRNSVKAQAA